MTKAFSIAILFLALVSCTETEIVEYGTPVESVSVLPTQTELAIGEHRVLVATVLPVDATNKNVKWDSDKPEIVRVDGGGELLALAVGEAVITVTTEDGAKSATCRAVVQKDATFNVSMSGFPGLSGSVDVPYDKLFDNVRAEISGIDWEVIATIDAQVTDKSVTLTLPEALPADRLCKVARDDYRDYEGFWPATEVSDRKARVAGLGDIIAYRGDSPVGRLYLTDWNGVIADKNGACFVDFHYADRPFILSGRNLTSPRESPSFTYEALMNEGWNIYTDRYDPNGRTTITTTEIPEDVFVNLRWRFEPW